jgi:hypothetical protein
MTEPLFWHRVQFGFTITFHYLFPQLTMGPRAPTSRQTRRGTEAMEAQHAGEHSCW